jgi:hypothetical protein
MLVACGPRARIVGEVHDGFGHPLRDVDVSIPTTTFKDTTGSSGKYSVAFAPGKFSVNFAKPGYSSFSLNQEVSVETKVPLEVVTLYKHPDSNGIWLLGSSDYEVIPAGKLVVSGADRKVFAWVYQMSYRVTGHFAQIPAQSVYQFIDSSPEPLMLMKVSDQGMLAKRAEGFMGIGNTTGTVVKETAKKVDSNMALREVSLEPGRYAYVRHDGSGRFSDPVFPFEIQAKK